MRLIDADALKKEVNKKKVVGRFNTLLLIDNAPTVKAYTPKQVKEIVDLSKKMSEEKPQGEFSRKDLESWLYQIAMNNIGTDFEKSVVEIIHRLDGFERFVSEQKGGAE